MQRQIAISHSEIEESSEEVKTLSSHHITAEIPEILGMSKLNQFLSFFHSVKLTSAKSHKKIKQARKKTKKTKNKKMSEDETATQMWGRGRHSPRVLPSAAVRMDSLPDWHQSSLKLTRGILKRLAAEAARDGVEAALLEPLGHRAEVTRKVAFRRGER